MSEINKLKELNSLSEKDIITLLTEEQITKEQSEERSEKQKIYSQAHLSGFNTGDRVLITEEGGSTQSFLFMGQVVDIIISKRPDNQKETAWYLVEYGGDVSNRAWFHKGSLLTTDPELISNNEILLQTTVDLCKKYFKLEEDMDVERRILLLKFFDKAIPKVIQIKNSLNIERYLLGYLWNYFSNHTEFQNIITDTDRFYEPGMFKIIK